MDPATTVSTIIGILQAAQQAQALYKEVSATLSSDQKAAIDAEIAKLAPQEVADEAKAEADLQVAAAA